MNWKFLLPIFVISIVFISGCTGNIDVSNIVKTLPEVESFLQEHPNADITVVLWNSNYIQNNLDEIPDKCLPAINANQDYYKVDVSEKGTTITTFLTKDTKEAVCIVRKGLEVIDEAPENIIETEECTEELGNKAVDYVIDNFLSSQGLNAYLVDVEKEKSLCKIDIAITKNGEKIQDSTVYMTLDGESIILGQVLSALEDIPNNPSQETNTTTCEDLKKEDTPELDAFVVSYCPFGLQMQRILTSIVRELPELKDNIYIKYMGSISNGKIVSMHGDKEATENLRQICIREEQPNKYWDYLTCFIKEGNSSICLDEENVNENELDDCMTDSNRGLEYAQEDFDLQDKYSISGSPTLVLNGERAKEFDFGGRTAEAVKTLICCGFNNEPDVCSTELTTDQAATSFSSTNY